MIRSQGPASADAASPAEIMVKKLADLVRNELRLLARNLGEDVIGGHRHPRAGDGFHRVIDLQKIEKMVLNI